MGRSQNPDASHAIHCGRGRLSVLNGVLVLMLGAALVPQVGWAEPGWTGLGPDGGWVLALAVSPHPDGVIYVGTGSGVFRSLDDGASWQLSGLAGERVLALAIDPVTPGRLYAGVDATSGTRGDGGVFVSADGGVTWTPARDGLEDPSYPLESQYFHFQPVLSLLVNPNGSGTVWAGTDDGLFTSSDGGATWAHSAFDDPVEVLAASRNVVLAAVRDERRLYRSVDAGMTWSQLVVDLAQASGGTPLGLVVDIAVAAQDPDVVFVITDEEIFRSDDGGAHWHGLGSLPTTVEEMGHATLVAVAVDPRDPDTVVLATRLEGVFESHDAGASWQSVGTGLECGPDSWGVAFKRASAVAFAPAAGAVVLGTERHGVFLRPDGGDAWRPSSRGLHAVEVSALGIDPERPWRLLAATRGLGLLSSRNGGVDWTDDNQGIGDECGPPDWVEWFAPTPDCRMMNDVVWEDAAGDALAAGECGIYQRTTSMSAWGLSETSRPWVSSMAAVSARELWAVWRYSTLARSLDGGATWTEVWHPPSGATILSFAAAGDRTTLAVGTGRGLWLSTDAGTTWKGPVAEVNAACGQGEWTAVWAVAFDPAEPQRAAAGTACGLFVGSPDGSWRHAGLNEHTVTALAFAPGRTFAGTADAGVWVGTDAEQAWQRVAGPPGLVSVNHLRLDTAGRRLFAATSDHGVFALDLPQPAPRRGGSRTGQARPARAERVPLTP